MLHQTRHLRTLSKKPILFIAFVLLSLVSLAQNDCNGGPPVGTPCDDGDPCTLLDEIQSDCTCAGFTDPNDAFTITPSAEKVCGGDSAYFTITGPALAMVSYELDGIGASIELNELGVAVVGLEENLDSTQTAGDIVVLSILGYTLGQGVGQCAGILYLSDTLVDYNGVNPRIVGKNFFGEDCNDFGFSFQLELDFPAGSTLHFSTNYPVNVVSIIQPSEDSYTTTTGEEFEITRTDGVMHVFALFDELHLLDINANFNLIVRFDSIDYEGCIAEIAGLIDTTIMPEPEFDLNLRNVGCLYVNDEDYYGQNRPAIEYNYVPKAFPAFAQGLSGEFINSIWDDLDFEFEINGAIYHFNEETDFVNSVNGNFFELRPRSSSGVSDCSGSQCPIMFCLGADNQVPDPILNDTIRVQPIAVSNANGCRRLFYTGETELILFDTQQLITDSVLLTCGEDLLLEGNISYEGNFLYDWSVTTYGLPFLPLWLQSPNSSLGNENAIGVTQPGSYFFSANSWDYGCPGFRKEFYVISNSGAPCDDSNPCTINDLYDENCTCAGAFADSDNDGVCDAQEVCENAGTPCDDGDPYTLLDKIQPDCTCAGFANPNDAFTITPSADKVCGGDSAYFTITGPAMAVVSYLLGEEVGNLVLDANGFSVLYAENLELETIQPDTIILSLIAFELNQVESFFDDLEVSASLINYGGYLPYFFDKNTTLNDCQLSYHPQLGIQMAYPASSTVYLTTNYPIGVSYNSGNNVYGQSYGTSFEVTTDDDYGSSIWFDDMDVAGLPSRGEFILKVDSVDYGGCIVTTSLIADTTAIPALNFSFAETAYAESPDGTRFANCADWQIFPLVTFDFWTIAFPVTYGNLNWFNSHPAPEDLIDFDFEFVINDSVIHFNNFNSVDCYYASSCSYASVASTSGYDFLFSLGTQDPCLSLLYTSELSPNDTISIGLRATTAPDGCRYFFDFYTESNYALFPTTYLATDTVLFPCNQESVYLNGVPLNDTWSSDYHWSTSPMDDMVYIQGPHYALNLEISAPGEYYFASQNNGNCENYRKEYYVVSEVGASCDDNDSATINDTYNNDCICEGIEVALVAGCTFSTACNFNEAATEDDGSCLWIGDVCDDQDIQTSNDIVLSDCSCAGEIVPPITGCTSSQACNFEVSATIDDGSCVFESDTCDDMNAQTINDTITSDCFCMGQLTGCIDSNACNFNSAAEVSDGSCVYPGCMDNSACNFNIEAGCDDGSCTFAGCMNPLACNYDPSAGCDDGSCEEVIAYEIVGPQLPGALDTIFYSYISSSGSIYQWNAVGGIVLVPDDVAEVGVVWAEEGIGQLCVQETDAEGCVGPNVCLDIIVILNSNFEVELSGVMLFPNPTKSAAYVDVNADWMQSQLTVVSVIGEVVLSKQIQSYRTELNLEDLASGLYLVQLKGKDGSEQSLRLVVE